MRIYIIRHADPDYPNNTITPHGHLEAQALAKRMAQVGLTQIYTSPLGRAIHTAQYTVDATGLQPTTLPWTAELSLETITGVDGKRWAPWNLEGEVIRGQEKMPTHHNWHNVEQLSHSNYYEKQQELAQASDEFIEGLGYRRLNGVYHADQPNEEKVAVFCHAGFGISWLAHLLELPLTLAWCGFFWAPSSVTTVLMEHRSEGIAVPRALCVGDTSHLYAEGIAESSRGITANFY